MAQDYRIEDKYLDQPKHVKDGVMAFCPFHDDKNTPNLHVFDEGKAFKCFACGAGGSAFVFLRDTGNLPDKKNAPGRPVSQPGLRDVDKAHAELLKHKEALKFLKDKRLWTQDTVVKFKLGLKNDLITIPIFNRHASLLNIRLYNVTKKKGVSKFMGWSKGLGARVDLFPAKALEAEQIILCEGEPDAILMRQMGFNAAAFTGGVGSIKDEHLSIFTDKKVIVIFDIDEPGRKAAARITKFLGRICPQVKNVALPIKEPENGDITDYIISRGGACVAAKRELDALIGDTPAYIIPSADRAKMARMPAKEMLLEDAAMATNVLTKQAFKAIVAGKDTEPYLIPKKVLASCLSATSSKLCVVCSLSGCDGKEIDIGPYDPEIMSIVGASQAQARGVFRMLASVPKTCTAWNVETMESQNVEDMIIIPDIDHDSSVGRPYVSRRALLIDATAETNRPYLFTGWTAPHPASHHAVHLLEKAQMTTTSVESFEMNDEIRTRLEIFRPKEGQTILEKIDDIHSDLEENVTHIWNRKELLMLIDLVYHSVIRLKFQNIYVRRGWVEGLVIGDTRCGKSESMMQIMSHYRAGELVGAENLSFAGLVGGINQIGNRRIIAWGKMPLNDGRLIAIDEFSGMAIEEIERLSGVRASGIAEITKIQSEKTLARVRLIIMSNPRKLTLGHYSTGVEAIRDLIGKAEDIARFDLAVALSSDEVKPEEINRRRRAPVKHVYTSEACRDRVRWAWSRKAKDIVFTEKAVDAILWMATNIAKKFHSAIPLVEPSEQRIKIARMSVAMAIMTFSSPDGQTVEVTEKHAEAVYDFLYGAYIKPAMGYDAFSESRFRAQTIGRPDEVRVTMIGLGYSSVSGLIDQSYLSLSDFDDIVGGDRKTSKELVSFLVKNRCLKKPYTAYVKTQPFTAFLIKLRKEMEVEGFDPDEAVKEEPKDEQPKQIQWWDN